jgi:predicted metal-dependent hydrolase
VPDWLRLGEPALSLRLRRHPRARRLVLRVPASGGDPVLTAPARTGLGEIRRFALAHEGWLRERLAARPDPVAIAPGSLIPVLGQPHRIAIGPRPALDAAAGQLDLPGPEARLPAQAAAFLRERARLACREAVARHASRLGRPFGRISLRDPRTRWGSCSARGDLMFSWRLAMAPPDVLDYVAAHEVAHLVEMNHSGRFWAVLATLLPGFRAPRQWLRDEGGMLHRYLFRPPAAPAP